MSRLDSVRIGGWKSISDMPEPLELGPITVLIGANGAGKSNFVSFFRLLSEIERNRLQQFVGESGGADSLLHLGTGEGIDAELLADTSAGRLRYSFQLTPAAEDTLIFSDERVELGVEGLAEPVASHLGTGHKESGLRKAASQGDDRCRALRELIQQCRVFHFHDTSAKAAVRKARYIHANQQLYPDAGNLAAMLYLYQQKHPIAYSRIVETIRGVFPDFDDFALEPSRLNPNQIRLDWQAISGAYYYTFGPHQLSDGSLRAIALATLFLQPESDLPELIVLDEPELGLHPHAIATLAGLVRSVSHVTQVVLATQSTELLNHFDPSEVVVADSREGCTEFRRLDVNDLASWLEDYSLGDLLRQNVIVGGGPIP